MGNHAQSKARRFDVAVIGGSLGGVVAALSAARRGKKVYLCEETGWIGGQLTSQAVPPDEHPWIESCGATQSYMAYREDVRSYYRSHPQASPALKNQQFLRPGGAWVSRIPHEPAVAHGILRGYLQPYLERGVIELDLHTAAVSAVVEKDRIRSLRVQHRQRGGFSQIDANYFLDATECGDLLPIAGVDYRSGAESRSETGEPHAPLTADPTDMQPCTWVAALELAEEEEQLPPMAKPPLYDLFASVKAPYADNLLFSWYGPDAKCGGASLFAMFDEDDPLHCGGMWRYRRIIAREDYTDNRREVSLLNWSQNDYSFGNIFDDPHAQQHRELARQQTLCAVYWLRYHAPRTDGGKGYPVQLRPDIMGTADGLAMAPYVRESRRIAAVTAVCEQDLSKECQAGILRREDSVGVGHYAIDIHPTTQSHSFFYEPTWPFEIPLSAMIPKTIKNLLPACKNIGCTHLTNGCFRLHPVEWNVGEVAGYLAAFCLDRQITPIQVLHEQLAQFQALLVQNGIQLHWEPEKMEGFQG